MGGPQGEASEEDFQVVFMPEQAMRSITEDTIGELNEVASMMGQIHRIAITDDVLPSTTQLQYLQKSWAEIGNILTFLTDLTLKRPE
jgi:hypothetical protein